MTPEANPQSPQGLRGRNGGAADLPPGASLLTRPAAPGRSEVSAVTARYDRRISHAARDARLVDVFLHASAMLSAAEAANAIGVRPMTIHRWRATGGEWLSSDIRDGILAFLARWSMRSECPADAQ